MSDRKALLRPSGVVPGSYGSGSLVPVIVVDAEGRITQITTAAVSGGGSLTVKEIDGAPNVASVSTIRFSNGTVTDDGGGQVTVAVGGGAAAWSGLTDPSGNLALAMDTRLTAFTWGGNYGSSVAFDIVAANTSATGALMRLRTGISNNMPPLLIEPRTGQSFKADHLQSLELGKSAPGASDTDGFVYLGVVGSNGAPTGTPTSHGGFAPIVVESDGVNDERTIWLYAGSKWNDIGGVIKRWDTGSGSGNQTLDFNSSSAASVARQFTCTGNVTFTAWNNPPKAGSLVTVVILQDATGSRTVTWPSAVKWPGGTAPTLTTTGSKRDVFQFVYDGSNYYNVAQTLNL